MIYLIDDKNQRRLDCNWSDERVSRFEGSLKLIQSWGELEDWLAQLTPIKDSSWILAHETFERKKEELQSRLKSLKMNERIIYFSGGIVEGRIGTNRAAHYCSVDVIYNNLAYCLEEMKNRRDESNELVACTAMDFLYGPGQEFECTLEKRLELWGFLFDRTNKEQFPNTFYALKLLKNMVGEDLGEKLSVLSIGDVKKYLTLHS